MKSKSAVLMLAAALGAAIPSRLSAWGETQVKRRVERRKKELLDHETIAKAEAKRLRKQQKRLAHAPR